MSKATAIDINDASTSEAVGNEIQAAVVSQQEEHRLRQLAAAEVLNKYLGTMLNDIQALAGEVDVLRARLKL